jgi:hypothetical protein
MSDQPAAPAPGSAASRAPGSAAAPAPRLPVGSPSAPRPRHGIHALILLTTLLAIVATFAVWADRLLLNPDNWSATSTQLLQNAKIRDATANYAVDQLYANVDIAKLLESGLPKPLRPLAGPAPGALRHAAVRGARLALAEPRMQSVWAQANRRAAQAFVVVVDGGKDPVKIQRGLVTLDLVPVIDDIAARLGLPSGIGAKLPPSAAHLRIVQSDQILLVQDIGGGLKDLALALSIAVPLLYLLAIGLARGRRRRAVMSVGFGMVTAGLMVLLGRAIMESQVPASLVADASVRPAATAVVSIATSMLAEIAGGLVLFGALAIIAAWLAGPADVPVALRRVLAPHLRNHPVPSYGIAIAVIGLVLIARPLEALGTLIGAFVFAALGLLGTALLRQQAASEFPDGSGSAG